MTVENALILALSERNQRAQKELERLRDFIRKSALIIEIVDQNELELRLFKIRSKYGPVIGLKLTHDTWGTGIAAQAWRDGKYVWQDKLLKPIDKIQIVHSRTRSNICMNYADGRPFLSIDMSESELIIIRGSKHPFVISHPLISNLNVAAQLQNWLVSLSFRTNWKIIITHES